MQLPNELKQAIDNNAFCALATKINEKEMQNHLMWVDYKDNKILINTCLLYTSPSPRDATLSRMPSSA